MLGKVFGGKATKWGILLVVILVMLLPVPASGATPAIETKLVPSDIAWYDEYGFSVSIDGNTALAGSIGDDVSRGSVYVFVRTEAGWAEQAKLTPYERIYYDRFGYSVSIDGDTALVGKPSSSYGKPASAYVFVRDPSGERWHQQANLLPSDGQKIDGFGKAVSISGDTALVSAAVFVRNGTSWSQEATLAASDGAPGDGFGRYHVSIDGDTAVVGSAFDDDGCPGEPPEDCNTGSVYVFVRSQGNWTQQAKLTASDGEPDDRFGGSLSISGNTIVVGAWGDDAACPEDIRCSSGSAYVFKFDGTYWNEQDKLTPHDAEKRDFFGVSLSVSGNKVIVGAHNKQEQKGQTSHQGAAYVFQQKGSSWRQVTKLSPADTDPFFGRSVSLSGDMAVVGGPGMSSGTTGSVYAYEFNSKKGKK